MTFQTFTFYVFAAILVFAALRVVTTRNPVQAALWLVLSFFTAAGVWLLLQAEFLAIVLVLVYVGAVMVLFLFVVMMLDIDIESLRSGFTRHVWLGIATAIILALEIVGVEAVTLHIPGIGDRPGIQARELDATQSQAVEAFEV